MKRHRRGLTLLFALIAALVVSFSMTVGTAKATMTCTDGTWDAHTWKCSGSAWDCENCTVKI
jgi:hypothetical protein